MSYCFLYSAWVLAGCSDSDGDSGGKTDAPVAAMMPQRSNPMGVYAHYMPWFETDKTNLDAGKWGWHWTMNASLNPAVGEIASHYHPLTGAYASGDATVLDYQCLLMKYSELGGRDGCLVRLQR